jgi:hypothetical protein
MTIIMFLAGLGMLVYGLWTGHIKLAIAGVGVMATAAFIGQLGAWH